MMKPTLITFFKFSDMNLKERIKAANHRGLKVKVNDTGQKILLKSEEQLIQECKQYHGFSQPFFDYVEICHKTMQSKKEMQKKKQIDKLRESLDAQSLGSFLVLVQDWLNSNRGFSLRFNQLVALCALLISDEVFYT